MKKITLFFFVFLSWQMNAYSQTISITDNGTVYVNCAKYLNNLNKIWNVNIPTDKRLKLNYLVNIENYYDKVRIYSIDIFGNATLQETLTGSKEGIIYSLFDNGKMKIEFITDNSVCGLDNPSCDFYSADIDYYGGFQIIISQEDIAINYDYDSAGNRIERIIRLPSASSSLRSEGSDSLEEEEITPIEDVVAEQEIKIYPNPTRGLLTVEIVNYTNDLEADFLLTDLSGKTISYQKAHSGNQTFNLSNHPSGIYLLRININGENTTWKIIKE
jgi:hypothetical protein